MGGGTPPDPPGPPGPPGLSRVPRGPDPSLYEGIRNSSFRFRVAVELNQREMAALLGLTSRQVRNLTDRGMPCTAEGNSRIYDAAAAVQWYVEFKVDEEASRHSSGEREQLEIEKLRHQAREAKVRADLAESSAVSVDAAATLYEERGGIIRATVLRMPVRYADVVRPDDPAEGEAILEGIADDLLGSLQEQLVPPDLLGPTEVVDAA